MAEDQYKPCAHLIIDSRDTPDYIMRGIENVLYGTAFTKPYLPTPDEVLEIVANVLVEPIDEPT